VAGAGAGLQRALVECARACLVCVSMSRG